MRMCGGVPKNAGDRPEPLEIRGRAALFINPAHGRYATEDGVTPPVLVHRRAKAGRAKRETHALVLPTADHASAGVLAILPLRTYAPASTLLTVIACQRLLHFIVGVVFRSESARQRFASRTLNVMIVGEAAATVIAFACKKEVARNRAKAIARGIHGGRLCAAEMASS
jgi:hypothetical protein